MEAGGYWTFSGNRVESWQREIAGFSASLSQVLHRAFLRLLCSALPRTRTLAGYGGKSSKLRAKNHSWSLFFDQHVNFYACNLIESNVDPARMVISGCSYGGIQTLLTGERHLGVKALVPFAPGAMSWEQNVALQNRLMRAVDLAKAPVFLIQAANDYSLAPSRVLSEEANKKKKDFQSRRRTFNQRSIRLSAAPIRTGTGDFVRRQPMSGETMYWPFLKPR